MKRFFKNNHFFSIEGVVNNIKGPVAERIQKYAETANYFCTVTTYGARAEQGKARLIRPFYLLTQLLKINHLSVGSSKNSSVLPAGLEPATYGL